MNLSQILVESANIYYNYLKDNNKGIISYSIKQIEKLPFPGNDFLYRFKLNSKLNSIEDLQLQVFDKIFKKHQANIQIYDEENKSVVIRVSNSVINEFSDIANIDVENIKLIYDLKFLIKNVKRWFELYTIQIPTNKEFKNKDEIKFFNDCSKEQINAIKTALTKPISYIWGAPGTGKTQYVLTNSVLNYTIQDKKVIIVAPTNNAIEQVMTSLIKVTDQVNIPRNKIIRLGAPTEKFFNSYPEVCENEKLWKILGLLKYKINLFDEILKYKQKKYNYEKYYKLIVENLIEIKNLETKNLEIKENILDLQKELSQLSKKEKSLNSNYDNVLIRKNFYISKMSSITFKFKQLFHKKEKLFFLNKLKELSTEEDNIIKILDKTRKKITDLKQKIHNLEDKIFTISLDSLRNNLHKLNININNLQNFSEIEIFINEELAIISNELENNSQIYAEYENYSEEEIQYKLKDLLNEESEINKKSRQNRINNSLIIGMTLDCFIASQLPSEDSKQSGTLKFNAEHIFLDEAGYSCLAKALPIFSSNQPITLLGDHLQLPPVCELDESILETNPELSIWLQSSLYALDFFNNNINYLANTYKYKKLPNFLALNKQDLTLTYRFGQNLLDVLSDEIYGISMKSSPNKNNIEILYIDSPKTNISTKKRENQDEIKNIYNYLSTHYYEDIAILSPYRNQIFELKKKCWKFNKDNIMTIHGSQGQEWNTVILSICDTHDKYFTDSCNPKTDGKLILNTAISRVKSKLIIVCDYNYWINQPKQLICKLLQVAKPYINN